VPWDSFDIADADELTRLGLKEIGGLVRRRRHQIGMTQRRLGSITGIDQSMISRIENGRIKGVKFRRFARLVGALGGLGAASRIPTWFNPPPIISLDIDGSEDRDDDAGARSAVDSDWDAEVATSQKRGVVDG